MDPTGIISDEESQALRESQAQADSGPAPAGQIRDLHADHWERVLADRAPALEIVADRMVSMLKATGRRFFRGSVDAVAHPLRPARWGAWARQLPSPVSLNLLDIKPGGSKGLIVLDAQFVFMLTDIFFGGSGKGDRPVEMIEFTPMELRLARKFAEAIASDMKQAWKPFVDLDFSYNKAESNPVFAAIAGTSDTVSVGRYAFVMGEREFCFEIVLPATLIAPVLAMRTPGQPESAASNPQRWRNRLREDMQEARIAVRAVLTGSQINLRDIALARPGDVIHTDLPATVVLYAGDQPLMEGSFGVSQGRNAVRISKPANGRILGEKNG